MISKSLINQQKIADAQVNFQAQFEMALQAVDDPARGLAMEVSSSAASEQHNWLGAIPGFSEWKDQRKVSELRAENIVLVNKDYQNSIKIGRNDILDDRLGVVTPRINQLAGKAGLHYGDLAVQALIAGFSTASPFGTAYDGAAFFSTTHQDGEGPVQSNTATTPLNNANYFAARAQMWSLQDEYGDPLGIVPDTLVVGPSQEETALQITQADMVPSASGNAGVTNVAQRTANVIVSPRLIGAAANFWFLASMRDMVRPLILQIREPIFSDFESGGELEFRSKTLLFGAQGRHVMGYGLWQYIFGSNQA